MTAAIETALIGAGGALIGSVLQPIISGYLNKKSAENKQSAINRRRLGQMYAKKRTEALYNLAESITNVRLTVGQLYAATQQTPHPYNTDLLQEKLYPKINRYIQTQGRCSIFIDSADFESKLQNFTRHVSNAYTFLYKSINQNTISPTNCHDHLPEEFGKLYNDIMDDLREQFTQPINQWHTI